MHNTVRKLDGINRTLEKQNEIIQKMLDVMAKPENKFRQILGTVVLFATALGILTTIDVVIKWIIGG